MNKYSLWNHAESIINGNDQPYEVGAAVCVQPAAYVRAELRVTEDAAEHLHHHCEPVALIATCVHKQTRRYFSGCYYYSHCVIE